MKSSNEKQIRCLLLSRVRSGSTVFTRLLNSHPDIHSYPEIFNSLTRNNYFSYQAKKIRWNSQLANPEHSQKLFCDYIDLICKQQSSNKVISFDIKYETMHFVYEPWLGSPITPLILRIAKDKGWTIIHLTRRNYLRRLISNQRAISSGQYHKGSSEKKISQPKVHLDTEGMVERFEHYDNVYDNIAEFYSNYHNFLDFDYDDMFVQSDGESVFSQELLKKLSVLLGISDEFGNKPTLQKVTVGDISSIVENYDEVRRTLEGTRFENLLEK